jgi:protein-disulfide isomerase
MTPSCFPQGCKAPTPAKQAELSAYVAKRSHFSTASQFTLLESAPANDACFWRLHYRDSVSKSEITVYLTPDGKYLAPSLYDLSVDPLAEERAAAEKRMKAFEVGGPPTLGAPNAPITIVEFSDFQCPYCKRMTDALENGLTADERKNLRIVFRNYPLPMHPWAKDAAEVAGCAALQSDAAFWKLHDYLFQNQATFTAANIRANATDFAVANAGVDKAQFQTCLEKKLAVGGVTQDTDLGNANGVHATPTLFINGVKYDGTKDAAALRAIFAGILGPQSAAAGLASVK